MTSPVTSIEDQLDLLPDHNGYRLAEGLILLDKFGGTGKGLEPGKRRFVLLSSKIQVGILGL